LANAKARLNGSARDLAADVDRLNRRVKALEDEVEEARRLNRRLAELTDVVQELLVPLSQRDEAEAQRVLDRYSAGL
jgi:DNA repair exonuclease SbcCD ATPase subunit